MHPERAIQNEPNEIQGISTEILSTAYLHYFILTWVVVGTKTGLG